MTLAQPAAPSDSVDQMPEAGTLEPSRFTTYTQGCAPEPVGVTDRLLRRVERLLVPELSQASRRRVSRPRSRS